MVVSGHHIHALRWGPQASSNWSSRADIYDEKAMPGSRGATRCLRRDPSATSGEWSLRLARADDALHHHHKQHLALIPSADPAHPPAIDAIAQSCWVAETKEAGLDLQ